MINKARIKVARELARKLLQDANVKNMPIIIREVVPCLNVTIDKWDFPEDVSGIQVNIDGKNYIGYNENDPAVKKRATVGHEIGHLVLKHTDPNNLERLDYSTDQVKENEAWLFSRELLMPIKVFKEEFKKNHTLEYLAWKFWVSKHMVSIRISELGLLNKIEI